MRLCHGGLGSVDNIVDQLCTIRQRHVATIDVARPLLVNQKEMIRAGSAGDVDVFSDLDVAIRPQHGEASIPPAFQALRCKPVHANIPCAAIAAQQQLSKILQLRVCGVMPVGHLCRHHLSPSGAGEEEKLLGLMGGDVGDDSAILLAAEKPGRALGKPSAVWTEPYRLEHTTDRARLD